MGLDLYILHGGIVFSPLSGGSLASEIWDIVVSSDLFLLLIELILRGCHVWTFPLASFKVIDRVILLIIIQMLRI
jgi:hypothetical protein